MAQNQEEECWRAHVVNIKDEKQDLEVEQKIELFDRNIKIEPLHVNENFSSSETESSQLSSQEDNYKGDNKKSIEPVKSSNEILTELFKVFNAAPPNELLDDKNLIEKVKKHKKFKKKKHKKSKNNDNENNRKSEYYSGSEQEIGKIKQKHRKKKKHKHKHKSKENSRDFSFSPKNIKVKEEQSDDNYSGTMKNCSYDKYNENNNHRNKIFEKSNSPISKSLETGEDSHALSKNKRKRLHSRNDIHDDCAKKINYNDNFEEINESHSVEQGIKVKEEYFDKVQLSKNTSENNNEESDITLSDEETYLKNKERIVNSSSTGSRKDRSYNTFYAGMERSHSRDRERFSRDRDYNRNRYRDREHSSRDRNRNCDRGRERGNVYSRNSHHYERHGRLRSRTRSYSRSRSRDLGIDKKRLLEIARKNAISMFKRGNMPGSNNMSQEIKDKVLLKMRYGGRTVEDLTEFCKKISKGEDLSDLSSDEESDVDKGGNIKAFHHPFQLKEREPIVMHIRNSKPIVPAIKSSEQTRAITMQFPVSSGEQHRLTESWVPVGAKNDASIFTPTNNQTSNVLKSVTPKNVLGKPLPVQKEQEPAFQSILYTASQSSQLPPSTIPPPPNESNERLADVSKISSPVQSIHLTAHSTGIGVISQNIFTPDVPIPSTNDSVFSQPSDQPLDVSNIISKRLNAMRRLQENPLDAEAIKMMHNSQKEMSCWASSKYLPGQFTGSTGANILKPSELNSGPQIWARKNQLTSSKPVTSGMGMQLLQKMGWKPGEGLGPEKKGVLQPLLLDVKLDKRGLVAQGDFGTLMRKSNISKKPRIGTTPLNIQDKHPVCLLNELTSKRKWTPPMYSLTHENGPSHSRMFQFSVCVNGETFTPDRASNTKKEAKLLAAKNCLQKIGILPPD